MEFRKAFGKVNGARPSFLIPKPPFAWDIEQDSAVSYCPSRRKRILPRVGAGGEDAEQFTLHAPKKFPPTCADEASFSPDGEIR